MYAVQGQTWVVMGDPVGAEDRFGEVIRLFLERCDDFGGVPVFYEAGTAHLHRYADVGLTFVKMGEEATVELAGFTLEGGASARYRHAVRRLERDGGSFRVLEPPAVAAVIDELRAVSDDWLETRTGAEKGFSLGFFDERYLARCPVALVERGGRIEAFANLWASSAREELSIDLMRFRGDGPRDVMETLLVHVMLWGRQQGYRRFSLGMAPLAGVEESPVASLWSRFGAFVYAHGESAYHFQGLRAFKEKFKPRWESRYLVYPGGMKLPRIMADVAALIAGGYLRVFRR
jgi:phosphatidylglycerol lysyltransferase